MYNVNSKTYYRKETTFYMSTDLDFFNVTYEVENIIYRNTENNYSIFKAKKVKFDEGCEKILDDYIIKGVFPSLSKDDMLKSYASWVFDKNYGWQLQAKVTTTVVPSTIKGLKRFLVHFCTGVGKKKADSIIDTFGVNTLEIIKNKPLELTKIKGVTENLALKIHNKVIEHSNMENLSVFLFMNGVTNYNDVVTIYSELGVNALDYIKANPYILCDEISISYFAIADTIALNLNFGLNNPIRLEKLVSYYLTYRTFLGGDMYIPKKVMLNEIIPFLNRNGINTSGITDDSLEQAISSLDKKGDIVLDNFNSDIDIYPNKLYRVETETADIIKKFINQKPKNVDSSIYNKFFDDFEKENGFMLDKNQKLIVKYAYENRIAILTGGAGTGKTQAVKAVISFIEKIDKDADIFLCSPTGRAAKRLSEVTYKDASTIHKMLNLGMESENEFEDFNFVADYVICDESSMTDACLFYKLLKACDEANASLLLVGDKEQLPPVGAGLCFGDLVCSQVVPTVSLTTLHRQALESQIYKNATKVLEGVTKSDKDNLVCDVEKQDFFIFNTFDTLKIQELIIKSVKSLINLGTNFDDIIVLAPMRKTAIGVNEFNNILQQTLNPSAPNKYERKISGTLFRQGDRVIQNRNNYELDVFNGDMGKIVTITEDKIVVEYEDNVLYKKKISKVKRKVEYSNADATELELAYSITIHKAQGSEFPVVLMPIHPIFINLSRNIIYTAITRAKKRFVLVGDKDSLYNGIAKVDIMKRYTKLNERVAA